MTHIFSSIAVEIDPGETSRVSEKIWSTGGNTGNIVWFESIRRSIRHGSIGAYPDDNTEGTNIVIPMANQIHVLDGSLETWVKYLESDRCNRCRLTMIGLGAQLTPELDTPRKLVAALPRGQKDALRRLALRTESIGIRGSITAECLDLMGIREHEIIGCPSFYMEDSGGGYNARAAADKLCVSWGSADHRRSQYVREFFRRSARDGDILLLQAMDDFPRTLYEDAALEEKHMDRCYPDLDVSPQEVAAYIRERGRMFFDWDTWQGYLRREQFTLSVGCRFHGNMMSYLSGIPALWIVHDSRTRELCEALALPHIGLEEAAAMKERGQFADCCVYGRTFHTNREKMFRTYKAFLEENGIGYIL